MSDHAAKRPRAASRVRWVMNVIGRGGLLSTESTVRSSTDKWRR